MLPLHLQQQSQPQIPPPAGQQQYPVVAGAAGAAMHQSGGDLSRIPVGVMVTLVKAALTNGHKKYVPIDLHSIAHKITPAHVEPGRIDVRLSEFYRKLKNQPEEKYETPRDPREKR